MLAVWYRLQIHLDIQSAVGELQAWLGDADAEFAAGWTAGEAKPCVERDRRPVEDRDNGGRDNGGRAESAMRCPSRVPRSGAGCGCGWRWWAGENLEDCRRLKPDMWRAPNQGVAVPYRRKRHKGRRRQEQNLWREKLEVRLSLGGGDPSRDGDEINLYVEATVGKSQHRLHDSGRGKLGCELAASPGVYHQANTQRDGNGLLRQKRQRQNQLWRERPLRPVKASERLR